MTIDNRTGNCSLIATRAAFGHLHTDEEIWRVFERQGFDNGMTLVGLRRALRQLGIEIGTEVGPSRLRFNYTLAQFIKEFCRIGETWMVCSSAHAYLVQDREIIDLNLGGLPRSKVCWAFQVLGARTIARREGRVRFVKTLNTAHLSRAGLARVQAEEWTVRFYQENRDWPTYEQIREAVPEYDRRTFLWDRKRGRIEICD